MKTCFKSALLFDQSHITWLMSAATDVTLVMLSSKRIKTLESVFSSVKIVGISIKNFYKKRLRLVKIRRAS